MVEVLITYKEHKIVSFAVKGHSGFAPEGTDICCAGVSAVAQTTLLGLINHLNQKPKYQVDKGILHCELPQRLDENDEQTAQIILSTMEAGLISMQEAYPGYIKVDIRRC